MRIYDIMIFSVSGDILGPARVTATKEMEEERKRNEERCSLGSDSGNANALYSAPKRLIDPKFCTNMPTPRLIEIHFK